MADREPKTDQELPEDALHRVWQGRILLANRHMERFGNTSDRWTENVKALAGDFNSEAELGSESIDVNMVRSTIKSTLPPLYVSEPHISTVPTVAEYKGRDNIAGARHTETEINYWIRELETKQEVKEIVYDGDLTNVGYAYIGWAKAKDVKTGDGPVEYSDRIKGDQPFVRRVSPKMLLVPPGYKNLNDAPWCDIIFTKPLIHVQRMFGTRADDVPTRDYKGEWDDPHQVGDQLRTYLESEDARLVDLHNIWCKETRKVYIVVKGHDQFLEEPKRWPWDIEGLPVVRYQPEHISDEYFGTPPITYGMPQNKELNATRTAMRKRRSKTKAVVFIDSDLTEVADKYAQAEDGEMIQVDLQGADIRSKMWIDPGLPFDGGDLVYDGVIKGDIHTQFGLGQERRGTGDPNVDSATASANIEKGTQIRESDKSDAVRSLWLGIARGLWMVLKQHPDVERTRLIAGNIAGEYEKVSYSLKELHGEYNFRMDLGSMTVVTPRERQAQARVNYQLLRQDPMVSAERLILDLLDANQTLDPQAYLISLRSPEEEHQMMMQGLPVEANERDDHVAHIQRHDAQERLLDETLKRLANSDDDTMKMKVQLYMTLLIAHGNGHYKELAKIQGQNGQSTGAQNVLANESKIADGSETEAELAGQPLTRA